ncbi:MAG: O-antigen ligase family protein [Bryobacteraceae bacterium]
MRVLPLAGLILLFYGLLSTRLTDWLPATPTVLFLGMTAWMLPSGAFGDWPGGSAMLIVGTWGRALLYYLLVVCLGRGLIGVMSLMSDMAWATATIILMGLLQATKVGTRFAIGELSLSNPNDLALVLVLGLPFCAWYALTSRHPRLLRLALAAVLVYGLLMVLLTGSRMGLLSLVCIMLVLIITAPWKFRILLLGATLICGLAAIFVLPQSIQQRYQTLVDDNIEDAGDNLDVSRAIESSEGRWSLLVNSLRVTLQHPVFGVGPGNFTGANAQLGQEAGHKGNWQVTHNSYTQVSSECGIPAALMFVGLVVYCLRRANRLRKAMAAHPELRVHAPMAFWLFISLVAYAFCAALGSLAYGYYLPLLAGMLVSLDQAVAPALARPKATPESQA